MWKDFFYYSKSERRAVYGLSVLIVLFTLGLIWMPDNDRHLSSSTPTDSLQVAAFSAEVQERVKPLPASRKPEKVVKQLPFDPNLADSIELIRLGLSPSVARNVLRYREEGGRFHTPEAFSRIYGLTEEKFQELKPYIRISDSFVRKPKAKKDEPSRLPQQPEKKPERPFKYPEGTLVDVATADTTELKKIPGIGTGIAKAIVAYRDRLGGFYALEQLKEVPYLTPELMKWFTLEKVSVRHLEINRAGLDELRAHPYLNFYQAKVIVEHRRKKGEIKSLSQLSLYEEFTGKDLERLAAYIRFD